MSSSRYIYVVGLGTPEDVTLPLMVVLHSLVTNDILTPVAVYAHHSFPYNPVLLL